MECRERLESARSSSDEIHHGWCLGHDRCGDYKRTDQAVRRTICLQIRVDMKNVNTGENLRLYANVPCLLVRSPNKTSATADASTIGAKIDARTNQITMVTSI